MIMDGYNETPTVWQTLLVALSRKASKRRERDRSRTWVVTAVRLILHMGGFGCLTLAGFLWSMQAGLITGGLSLFALSWLATSGTANESPQQTNLR